VLVPSSGYEIFPLVILESFQQKTPVIARSLGGLTEIMEVSNGGLLYHESAEMRSAMERLQRDPALRQEMGDRGYKAYQERWSEEVHLQSYFQLLEETAIQKFGTVPWNETMRSPLRFPVPVSG
jgi:glycosyltransferase involved in cell wall biosynthesis